MYTSWKHYLTRHPNNRYINDNAGLLQQKFSNCTTPESCFTELTKLKQIICLSRIPLTEDIQATFYHDAVSTSIAQTIPYHFALTGFGKSARAVRLNITQHFSQSRAAKIPPYGELISLQRQPLTPLANSAHMRLSHLASRRASWIPTTGMLLQYSSS